MVVIGGGPAGSTAARIIALGGHSVLLVEEHPKVGVPTHCTGKISVNACRELNLNPPVLNELRGAIFHSPSGATVTVERKETQAYIVDRAEFDIRLAGKAVEAGATLRTSSRVRKVVVKESSVSVGFDGDEQSLCRAVVAADGSPSGIAHQLGLYTKKPAEVRFGVQKEVSGLETDSAFAEVFFSRQFAPGFFAWLVPTGRESARVGLAVKTDTRTPPRRLLDCFMREHPSLSRVNNRSASDAIVHTIPTGGSLARTVSRGILIAGDAAGQIKSTTGGGLYYGVLCSQIAGRIVCEALDNSKSLVLDEKSLEPYEYEWKLRLGEEIAFSQRTRAFIDSLTDSEIEYLFRVLNDNPSLKQLIESIADIDYQSRIALTSLPRLIVLLAKKPRLLYKATRYYSAAKLQ